MKKHLDAFEKISLADASAGPIAALDLPSRFRWLTAKRSTVFANFSCSSWFIKRCGRNSSFSSSPVSSLLSQE